MGKEGMSVNVWGSPDLYLLVDAMKSLISDGAMGCICSVLRNGSKEVASASSRIFDRIFSSINDQVVKISVVLMPPRCLNVCGSMKDGSSEPNTLLWFIFVSCRRSKGSFIKAVALGVEPGPKYYQLQSGNSEESDHQNITVHPCDVMEPSIPGPIVLLVDCPTLSHLEELLSLQSLTPCYSRIHQNNLLKCPKT
ncbi:hypothetical protein FXO38_23802 [Capsicum annuum]|uniref:Uncharacterized protein n=1 Tax=Capsicum annuum TaxID=4072 RepID=A0A2G2Y8M6_CAPAN|nr:hypothetical protein FXO38_23802 [Capsicum annuum]KAF3640230.1 hypothetical protein FXO37_23605 [Capsicum annuum]PHT66098.1 hypothetical protein T459_30523 [Capsicum annuum]